MKGRLGLDLRKVLSWYEVSELSLLLMIYILHVLIYQNNRNYGSLVYEGSRRVYTINGIARGPKDRNKTSMLHFGSKAQDNPGSRNHVL